ncbi:MAG: diguanylate cyclase, partial [Anaerolinea sp.]|nr:diguanylate cyclase [Anaerolinea sp.]
NLLTQIIHPDDLPSYDRHRREVTEPPAPGEVEFRVLCPDGTWRWIDHVCQPVFDNEGRFLGTRGSNRDITERVQAEGDIRRQLSRLSALREIDRVISGSVNLNLTLNSILTHVIEQLKVDAASVLTLNLQTMTLEFAAGRGFRSKAIERSRLRLNEGHAGRAAYEKQIVHIHDLREKPEEFLRKDLLSGEEVVSYFAVPLIAKGKVSGVLEVFQRSGFEPDQEWLDYFEILAGQIAIAIDSISMFNDLQRSNMELVQAYDATIEGWSQAMDLRDKETEGHTLRVTELTERLARSAGMSEAELIHVRRGALLHDMGKLGVPDHILLKPGKLTDEEWEHMQKHPQFAFDMLSPIAYLRPALDIPYCHHEKWDGSGYPRGLKGEQIPLAARLFAIVDVWDALRSDRPYRAAWPEEKIIEHIMAGSGSHFDPKAVEIFLKTISQNGQS